jgi:TonB family protein
VFDPKNRIHWVAAIVIAIILILILGVASTASGQEPEVWNSPQGSDPGPCGARPAYLARDTEPRILDSDALRESLVALQEEERAEEGGRTVLWVCVAETGQVNGVLVHTTSGDCILDSIALRVIADARYIPAAYRGRPTTVWIAQPVDFIPRTRPVEL